MNTNNTIDQLETEAALNGRKLTYGVALNDIKGSASRYGKNTVIYSKWAGAVHRSHDVKEGKTRRMPTAHCMKVGADTRTSPNGTSIDIGTTYLLGYDSP